MSPHVPLCRWTHDLGITSVRYKSKANRKIKLAKLVADLNGRKLSGGHLELTIAHSTTVDDWKLVSRKIPPPILARSGLKQICSNTDAEEIAEEFTSYIQELPDSGSPQISYLSHLARYIPKSNWFEALSIVKSDYRETIRKNAISAFVYELKRIAESKQIPFPQKQK